MPNVLITGGSRGIGYATAELFAQKGWHVAICSRSEKDVLAAAEKIGAVGIQADMGESQSVEALFQQLQDKLGGLDALVNNAGIFHGGDIFSLTDEQFDAMMNINVRGLAQACRHAFGMMKNKGGAIVNISSLAGIESTAKFPKFWGYTASKFAVTGLTEALAVEGKPYGIRVNGVAPGATETQMLAQAAPGLKPDAQPKDIAKLIYHLCDTESSGILSGAMIPVHSNG